MIRTQIYLPEEVHTKLTRLAAKRKAPMAQLVREYVENGLDRDKDESEGNAHVLLELAEMAKREGWFGKGPADLATNHDKYLAEALEKDLERIHKQYDDNS